MFRSIALAALLALAIVPSSRATTVLPISLATMTRASDLIVHGTVTGSRVEAVNGNERHLRTIVDVSVTELLRGAPGTRTVQLQLMGGRLGKWAMEIPGMPTFSAGEEVVLFLEKTSVNWALTGLAQGKFTVFAGEGGKKMVRRKLDGLHFVALTEKKSPDTAAVPLIGQPDGGRVQALDALLAEVRALVARPAPLP